VSIFNASYISFSLYSCCSFSIFYIAAICLSAYTLAIAFLAASNFFFFSNSNFSNYFFFSKSFFFYSSYFFSSAIMPSVLNFSASFTIYNENSATSISSKSSPFIFIY
jgi:hypothetical protein